MDIVSAVQNILYIDKMYYIKCRNAKKIKKTLTKQEKSRYNSALLKQKDVYKRQDLSLSGCSVSDCH